MLEDLRRCVRILQRIITEMESGEPALPPEALKLVESGICLDCKKKIKENEASSRGLHAACLKRLKIRIRNNEFTESQAIAAGLLSPKQSPGRRTAKDDDIAKAIASLANVTAKEISTVLKHDVSKADKETTKLKRKKKNN